MITICRHCGFKNDSSALVCFNCYAILKPSEISSHSTTAHGPALQGHGAQTFRHNTDYWKTLDIYTVALFIGEVDQPVILKVIKDAFLGRKSESVQVHPLLDLTGFQAFEKGVSRLHAVIRRVGTAMLIEDLGSSNGTWINGNRLLPKQAQTLRSGDVVNLGSLSMEVFLGLHNQQTRDLGEPLSQEADRADAVPPEPPTNGAPQATASNDPDDLPDGSKTLPKKKLAPRRQFKLYAPSRCERHRRPQRTYPSDVTFRPNSRYMKC